MKRRCLIFIALLSACGGSGEPDDASVGDSNTRMDVLDDDADTSCGECDDSIPCTADRCVDGVCVYEPDDSLCSDGDFCNGAEVCDATLGCQFAAQGPCNDDDVCTIDVCDAEAETCSHTARDLDFDGDPDARCGGTDCADTEPRVAGTFGEVCADGLDNNCDGETDEAICGPPPYDVCSDPLDISAGGRYLVHTAGSSADHPMDCRLNTRDLVATFSLAERSSVEILAEGAFFTVALSLRSSCADSTSAIECRTGGPAALRIPALDAGTYHLVIGASAEGEIQLDVSFGAAIDPPANDDCSAPVDVSAGGSFTGSFAATSNDTDTRYPSGGSCGLTESPDVFYTFTTAEPQDVSITARSDVSLNFDVRTSCADPASATRCAFGDPAEGVLHSLPAGTYFIVLEGPASRPVDFTLDVAFSAATVPTAGDTCADAIPLISGTPATGTFADAENDLEVSCGLHYRDLVYQFDLPVASDVLLDLDADSRAALSLRTNCTDPGSQLSCTAGDPVRRRFYNLAAGSYFVVAENTTTSAYTLNLTATTPPTIPEVVIGNDNCPGAHSIPESGGLYTGDTTVLTNTYLASCGGSAASRDAAFRLELTAPSRVIATTENSIYNTVLHIHSTMCVSSGDLYCDDNGGDGATSRIDEVLAPGTHFIIVDGFGSASAGAYVLDVSVIPE